MRGRPAANELALFVCRITSGRTVDEVCGLVPNGPGRSTWAKYMNGTEVVPKHLLGELIATLFREKQALLRAYTVEGEGLWKAAHAESLRPPGPETAGGGSADALVRMQDKLIDALEGQHRAVQAADKANAMISSLLQMGALLDTVITTKEVQLRSAADRERAEAELQLSQARLRLERTAAELEKAKGRRYTAEQAQQALTREVLEAREEIARLQQRMEAIGVVDLPLAAALPPAPELLMENFDDALASLIAEGQEADQEIADLAVQAHLPPPDLPASDEPLLGSVVPDAPAHTADEPVLSRTTEDNPVTSIDTAEQPHTEGADPTHQASVPSLPTQPSPTTRTAPQAGADSHTRRTAPRPHPQANTAGFQGTTSSLATDLASVDTLQAFAHQLRALRFRAGPHNWPLEKATAAAFNGTGPWLSQRGTAGDARTLEAAAWFSGQGKPPGAAELRNLVQAMGATAAEAAAFAHARQRVVERLAAEDAAIRTAPSAGTPEPAGSPVSPAGDSGRSSWSSPSSPGEPPVGDWRSYAPASRRKLRYTLLAAGLPVEVVLASSLTARAQTHGPSWGNFWIWLVGVAILGALVTPRAKTPLLFWARALQTLAVLAGIVLPVVLDADVFGGHWIARHLGVD